MVYLETADGHKIFIIEPNNLHHLAKGGVTFSPDNTIAVMYTPDALWMAARLEEEAKAGQLTADTVDRIHSASMSRVPQVMATDKEGVIIHDGKPVAKA